MKRRREENERWVREQLSMMRFETCPNCAHLMVYDIYVCECGRRLNVAEACPVYAHFVPREKRIPVLGKCMACQETFERFRFFDHVPRGSPCEHPDV